MSRILIAYFKAWVAAEIESAKREREQLHLANEAVKSLPYQKNP